MSKEDEMVLVLPKQIAIPTIWRGMKQVEAGEVEKMVRLHGSFKRRGDVEDDPEWKQLIPYMVFSFEDKFFLMQRSDRGGEKRLHNKYSLGIGGHVNQRDIDGTSLEQWGDREFDEETDYQGKYQTEPKGLLFYDDDSVGQVHLGYVILLKGDSANIQIRHEHQSGKLATVPEIRTIFDQLETWSQLTFDFLNKQ